MRGLSERPADLPLIAPGTICPASSSELLDGDADGPGVHGPGCFGGSAVALAAQRAAGRRAARSAAAAGSPTRVVEFAPHIPVRDAADAQRRITAGCSATPSREP